MRTCAAAGPVDFEERTGPLPADDAPARAGEWRDPPSKAQRERRPRGGGFAAVAAARGEPPPLEAGDVVDVSKEDGSGVVECSVRAATRVPWS